MHSEARQRRRRSDTLHAVMVSCRQVVPVSGSSILASARSGAEIVLDVAQSSDMGSQVRSVGAWR